MYETVLGPVVPVESKDVTGYGFLVQKPGTATQHPVTVVFSTEQDAKEARATIKSALDKAIAVIEVG